MASPKRIGLYLRIRRLIDHDLSRHSKPFTPFAGFFSTIFAILILDHTLDGPVVPLGWIAFWTVNLAWGAFVAWRAYRLMRTAGIRGDRDFDRRTKFLLSSEYQASESVNAARQRKRAFRRRSTRA